MRVVHRFSLGRRRRSAGLAVVVMAAALGVFVSEGSSAAAVVSTTYEAEAGTLGGGTRIDADHAGFTGSGFANFPTTGGSLQWVAVDGGAGGSTTLTVRFANGSGKARTGRLGVNGVAQNITTVASSSWTTWVTMTVTVPLNAGATNTIRLESNGQDLANIDHIVVAAPGDGGGNPTAPAITTQPVSQVAALGAPVTFSVAADGTAPLAYQWRRNGVDIAGATAASYTIAAVQQALAGQYTVVVSNAAGSVTSNVVTLTINETPPPVTRPRVVVITDGEVDDRSSMVRFLTYASDYDVVGIIQANSNYQKSGHSGDKWLEHQLDLYDQVLPKLRVHKASYPDTTALRAAVRLGNENSGDLAKSPPNMSTKDTPGSQLIIERLLDSDPRPVHFSIWGGANTLAYALYKLKTQYSAAQYNYAVSRVSIYTIWYQDAGGQWIESNVPGAKIFEAGGDRDTWRGVWNYMSVDGYWKGLPSANPKDVQVYMDKPWLNQNVKTNHGPLGASYPQTYTSEGDTPSFLPLIDNGLTQYTDYTLGGWGGRPVFDRGSHMTDGADDGNYNKPYWRWVIAAQNDWAARMDWQVASSFGGANHPPVARVSGGLERTVAPGQTLTLDASPTTDPDGNALTFRWWQYADADSAGAKVSIDKDTAMSGASFVAPNEPGKKIHIMLEVTDSGSPSLTHWQRMVITIT